MMFLPNLCSSVSMVPHERIQPPMNRVVCSALLLKNLLTSEPVQLKLVLFKGQLYSYQLKSHLYHDA